METMVTEKPSRSIWQTTWSIYRYVIGVNILLAIFYAALSPSTIVASSVSALAAFFAVKWGIKATLSKGAIELQYFFKIGLLVGAVPLVVGLLLGSWAILENLIFVTEDNLLATNSWETVASLLVGQLSSSIVNNFLSALFFGVVTWILLWKLSAAPKPAASSFILKTSFLFLSIVGINLLGIAILAGLIFGSQKVSQKGGQKQEIQQKDETANWQTYRNEEFGFEIKYPSYYAYQENTVIPRVDIVYFFPQENKSEFGFEPEIFISVDKEPQYLSFHGTFGTAPRSEAVSSTGAKLISSEDVTINNVIWKKDNWLLFNGLTPLTFSTKRGSEYYSISLAIKEKEEILNQILSTFRFIGKADDMETMIKYTDEEFGFSLYYPESFLLSSKLPDGFPRGDIYFLNAGPYDDIIIMTKYAGDRVADNDAKFGSIAYFYDQNQNRWMGDYNTDGKQGVYPVEPKFYTSGNFPVFDGIGRWKTNIVAISHNKFLIINMTGGGFTEPLDPLTKTIGK